MPLLLYSILNLQIFLTSVSSQNISPLLIPFTLLDTSSLTPFTYFCAVLPYCGRICVCSWDDEQRKLGLCANSIYSTVVYIPSRVTEDVKVIPAAQINQAGIYIGQHQYRKMLEADNHFNDNGKAIHAA